MTDKLLIEAKKLLDDGMAALMSSKVELSKDSLEELRKYGVDADDLTFGRLTRAIISIKRAEKANEH